MITDRQTSLPILQLPYFDIQIKKARFRIYFRLFNARAIVLLYKNVFLKRFCGFYGIMKSE